ncbi:MAG: hypothetical protein AAF624_04220 [Bacteroidota bacterium]
MSLDAQVIAIGPFLPALVDCLDYPARFYEKVPPGTTVICTVFQGLTNEGSTQLAEALGFRPFDLGKHAIGLDGVDDERLRMFDLDAFERFDRLREAGFQFYYLPNG